MDKHPTLKILVVDDEAALQETLIEAFTREGHSVTAVATGQAALKRLASDDFDIVVLDVALRVSPNGYETCRALREQGNLVPIIMLTSLDTEADVVQGLEAGADDYIAKPVRIAELRSRVRAVLRRSRTHASGYLSVGPVSVEHARRHVSVRGNDVRLTFSEFELLIRLMTQPGRAFTREELLEAIWGATEGRDLRSVDIHISNLRAKIEEAPEVPRLILTVRGSGYRFAKQ